MLSFRVGTCKNKNINHRVKETCAIQTTMCLYSMIQNVKCPKFLFLMYFFAIYKKIILEETEIVKKRNTYM